MSGQPLLAELARILGADAVRTDRETLALASGDLHVDAAATPLAVVRPRSAQDTAAALAAVTAHGHAAVPRGGGLSYTGGYAVPAPDTVLFDMAGMNRIVAIAPDDMTITVEAGVTWKQIAAALKPLGLRLPFIGTFSGAGATVGGGLGHGALFFGSARYGSAADAVLGMEVALADGTLLRTGQGALAVESKPFSRSFGPDLTGLFTHDGGMFGIKTQASLRLIEAPREQGYASFAFADLADAAAALSAIARADVAEEVYVLSPEATAPDAVDNAAKARAAAAVARNAGGAVRAVKALAGMAKAGADLVPPDHYSLHLTAAGRSAAAVQADLAIARERAAACGGVEIAATVPQVARAELFRDLDAVIGAEGRRWAALNAKVAHSDARRLIAAFDVMIAPFERAMADQRIKLTRLVSALGNHSFSFEVVLNWHDGWRPLHRAVASPRHLARFQEPPRNPAATRLVDHLRGETVALFRRLGAASNQIGRTYPFRSALNPAATKLLDQIKAAVDPSRLMNPGVLEF